MICIFERPPHELPGASAGSVALGLSVFAIEERMEPIIPLSPRTVNRFSGIWFLGVVPGQRPVAPRRPPRSTDLTVGQRTELEAHRRRLPLQRSERVGLHLGLVFFHRLSDILLAVLEHPVDQ